MSQQFNNNTTTKTVATPLASPPRTPPFNGQLAGSIQATITGMSDARVAAKQGPEVLDKIRQIEETHLMEPRLCLEMAKLHPTGIHCMQPIVSDFVSIMKMECSYSHSREEESIGVNAGYGPAVFGVRSDHFEEREGYNAYLVGGTLIKLKRGCRFCGLVVGDDKPITSDFALNTGVTLTRLDVAQQ